MIGCFAFPLFPPLTIPTLLFFLHNTFSQSHEAVSSLFQRSPFKGSSQETHDTKCDISAVTAALFSIAKKTFRFSYPRPPLTLSPFIAAQIGAYG